ncbi:MAG TPA: tetratricopeptide repeat protein [Chthoniobacteraceae bacterium]|jgi:TolA-binding protein|nr:tetratricopeptide repeat protein [Chthoniobacteraceae bacterium]
MKAPRFLLIGLGVLCGVTAQADINVIKKDSTKAVAKNLRRQGDNIIVTMELPPEKPGDPVKTGDIGIPISQIEKIEFPEPGVLKTAPDLIVQGKAEDALAQVDQAAKYYEGFRDAPGSWWRQLTLLKMNTLIILGREKDAAALADTMSNLATEPESQRAAKVLLAAAATRRGDAQKAADALDSVLKDSKQSDVLASAAIYKGQSYLALKDWENALLSFLQIPVLYPEAKELAPASMLGVGRAHFGLEDFPTAKNTFKELMKTFKGTPEATAAKAELELIAKREKALSEPGAAKKDAPPANEPK